MVIAIIGILVSLLLPAVQSAREAARKLECKNNLKQIGLAIKLYEVAHKVYPPSGIVGQGPGTTSDGAFAEHEGNMFSWVVLILPQLEQGNLHDQFDFSVSVLEQPEEPQANTLKSMLCPSGQARNHFLQDANLTNNKRFAKGNYAAFVSPYHTDLQDVYPAGLSGHRKHRHKDIKDGASNTLLCSEVRTRAGARSARGVGVALDRSDDFVIRHARRRGSIHECELRPFGVEFGRHAAAEFHRAERGYVAQLCRPGRRPSPPHAVRAVRTERESLLVGGPAQRASWRRECRFFGRTHRLFGRWHRRNGDGRIDLV